MVLSDYDIKNLIKSKRMIVRPLSGESIRENGIDFRLADEIAHHTLPHKDFVLDPTNEEDVKNSYKVEKGTGNLVIGPKEQVLLSTYEYLELPDDVVGFVELRSTWARHGLSMPPTIIDAGFRGVVTLEVINHAPYSIKVSPMHRFAHVVFLKAENRVLSSYKNGSYSGFKGIKLPKIVLPDGTPTRQQKPIGLVP